ncbi:MAG: response regulator [Candidatus Dactylopiibacterium sp.]|nr:response regulator [Candidatus Dactylopiibacterium sp.]
MGLLDTLRTLLAKTPAEPEAADPATDAPGALPIERRTRPRVNAPEGTRVLVIDDSPTVLASFRKTLRSAGYVVDGATDAEQGLAIAHETRPSLIFLDIVLPGMNGFAALRQLRRDPELHDVPVIMISGNEHATEQFFGARIGADDFMKKPFSRLEIFARIERLLDHERVPRRIPSPAAPACGPAGPASVAPPLAAVPTGRPDLR